MGFKSLRDHITFGFGMIVELTYQMMLQGKLIPFSMFKIITVVYFFLAGLNCFGMDPWDRSASCNNLFLPIVKIRIEDMTLTPIGNGVTVNTTHQNLLKIGGGTIPVGNLIVMNDDLQMPNMGRVPVRYSNVSGEAKLIQELADQLKKCSLSASQPSECVILYVKFKDGRHAVALATSNNPNLVDPEDERASWASAGLLNERGKLDIGGNVEGLIHFHSHVRGPNGPANMLFTTADIQGYRRWHNALRNGQDARHVKMRFMMLPIFKEDSGLVLTFENELDSQKGGF